MGIFESIKNLVLDILGSVLTLAGDVLIFLLEMLLTAIFALLSTVFGDLDMSVIVNAINAIPPEVYNLAYRVGLAEVSTIVVGALMIRFVIQLIPFIRLGS
jgi:hypothetical protein